MPVNRQILVGLGMALAACQPPSPHEVRALAMTSGVAEAVVLPTAAADAVALGRMLFFDPLLSGNKDIACSTCHHPNQALGDGRSLPVGTAALIGEPRLPGPDHRLIPRNAPSLFDAGAEQVTALFWDARLQQDANGPLFYDQGFSPDYTLRTPLPDGLESILAAQTLFPIADRDEMRGDPDERDIFGEHNELASISDPDFAAVWRGVVRRIVQTEGYHPLLAAAFPDQPVSALGPVQMANSLAAFIGTTFVTGETEFDRFVAGDDDAISGPALAGAALFYGSAQCAVCHSGPLLTDEGLYNLAVRPIGRGPTREVHVDRGAALSTHAGPEKAYFFKTPRLRNVAETGPWMHNGAYLSLEEAIAHHADPLSGLYNYDPSPLADEVAEQVHTNTAILDEVAETLSPRILDVGHLSRIEIRQLSAFLRTLSTEREPEPSPTEVPSGLPLVVP